MKRGGQLVRRTPLRARTPMKRARAMPRDPALPKHGKSRMPRASAENIARGAGMVRAAGLRKVSPKRAVQLRLYGKLRKPFLTANPYCASPWSCGQRATEVQHRKGREGVRLLDMEWWAPSCHGCNMDAAHSSTGRVAEARLAHWLVDKDDPRGADELRITLGSAS